MAHAFRAATALADVGARLLDARGLEGQSAAWAALSDEAAEPNAFAAPWMLGPALPRFASNSVRFACAYDDDGRMIGLAPIAPAARRGLPLSHVETWRHAYCFHGAPLVRRGFEASALCKLAVAAASHPCRPSTLRLGPFAADGALARAFADRDDVRLSRIGARALWTVDGARSANAGSTRMRSELRRRRRRLAEDAGLTVRVWRDGDDLDAWLADFLRLESAGWKGDAGTALADDAAAAAYACEIASAAARRGALLFVRLDRGATPVAMTMNFVDAGNGWGFKSAYDERFARFSPGVLLVEDLGAVLAADPAVGVFDTCAAAGGAADRLWSERRPLMTADIGLTPTGALAVAAARLAARLAEQG